MSKKYRCACYNMLGTSAPDALLHVWTMSCNPGSTTFFAVQTGLKGKCFRGPAFKKPQMFSNEYLLQLI